MKLYLKFLSFCVVGGLAALVELGFFNIFYYFVGVFSISKIIGIFFALCFNFFINRRFTFSAHNGKTNKQVQRFILVYGSAFLVNFFVSIIVNSLIPGGTFYVNIAVVSGIIAQIPISFLGSLLWTFKV